MFVADRFIYLELQKTGCTHIVSLLENLVSGEKQVGKHTRLPENSGYQDKSIVGSIRNPWDWYISLWGFGCDKKGLLYKSLTRHKAKEFGFSKKPGKVTPIQLMSILMGEMTKPVQTFRRVYSDSNDPELFREWLHLVLSSKYKHNFSDAYGFSSISSFTGLLTYSYLWFFSKNLSALFNGSINHFEELQEFDRLNNILHAVIRTEFLEGDLIQALQQFGYVLSDEQMQYVYSSKRTNVSSRQRDVGFYYDSETIKLVAEKEKFIIEKYGYQLPRLDNSLTTTLNR